MALAHHITEMSFVAIFFDYLTDQFSRHLSVLFFHHIWVWGSFLPSLNQFLQWHHTSYPFSLSLQSLSSHHSLNVGEPLISNHDLLLLLYSCSPGAFFLIQIFKYYLQDEDLNLFLPLDYSSSRQTCISSSHYHFCLMDSQIHSSNMF